MDIFEQAKSLLDIREVAQHYGVQVNHRGKALCPFHQDKHPSLSFKDKIFTCFSCGATGDAIRLAGHLTGIAKPIDVVRRLNEDFSLGLTLDGPPDTQKMKAEQKAREHVKLFESWIKDASNTMAAYCRMLRTNYEAFAPKTADDMDRPHPLFLEACHRLAWVEDTYDAVFIGGLFQDKVAFCAAYREEVARIEQRLRGDERDARRGGIPA